MILLKTKEFLEELSRWGIETEYENGRIYLIGGREDAREHFSEILRISPELEGTIIWELAQTDANIMDAIEERRAMRWVEGGDDSISGAIMCNIPH